MLVCVRSFIRLGMSDRLEAGEGGRLVTLQCLTLLSTWKVFLSSSLFLFMAVGGGAVKLGCVLVGACPRDSCL